VACRAPGVPIGLVRAAARAGQPAVETARDRGWPAGRSRA